MKVKLLVFAAALLMLTSLSFAQPFSAALFNDAFVLTDACNGGNPLPDGTPIQIYLDANSNGPDAADGLAPLCDNPPDCPTGPLGTVNFNTFYINGVEMGLGAGMFYGDTYLTSSLGMPTVARYYLKITTAHAIWTSSVFIPVVGPQEFDLTTWTCEIPPNPCTPQNQTVVFAHGVSGQQDQPAQCVVLCHDNPTATVCLYGIDGANHVPTVTIHLDGTCRCGDAGLATLVDWAGDWVYDAQAMSYCRTLSLNANGEDGSVCLTLDFILAVSMGNVAITPDNNAVNVKFNTLSESNVSKFEIRRDHQVVARLDAANSPTGHDYSYTDNSVNNGTVYTYELVVVNTDGSSQVVATQSVSPSMYNGVVTEYALHQNFPNPFNPTTSIRFDLVEKNFVSLKVYNANGQEVATVVSGERNAGVNVVNFDATNLTSGLYFYTVKVGNVYSATKKMLLVK